MRIQTTIGLPAPRSGSGSAACGVAGVRLAPEVIIAISLLKIKANGAMSLQKFRMPHKALYTKLLELELIGLSSWLRSSRIPDLIVFLEEGLPVVTSD